jgi:hypothetical protein
VLFVGIYKNNLKSFVVVVVVVVVVVIAITLRH